MVKITLEFKNAEEAIVALGKMIGAGAPVASPSPAQPAAPALRPGRKARADKGQPRAPYAPRAMEAAQPSIEARTVNTVGAGEAGTAAAGTTEPSKVGEQPAVSNSTTPAVAEAAQESAAPQGATARDVPDAAPKAELPAVAAPIPSAEEAQKALEKLFETKGLPACQDVFSRFGVKRLRELLPENRADFIALVEGVLAGKPV